MTLSDSERAHLQRSHTARYYGQERERGRSRVPKPTVAALELRRQEALRKTSLSSNPTHKIPRAPPHRVARAPAGSPARHPPPQGKSPDRSVPGALEVAIHEAHARGDLRQCLQWVLEIQGIHLAWDDPRLDTVTEDDLCFSEQTGMGVGATPEERRRAEAYWAMRQMEDDEKQRLWEASATHAEKEASRRLRVKYEAERNRCEARRQFFEAPRLDGGVEGMVASPPATLKALSLSHSHAPLPRASTIPRMTRDQPQELFPVDEYELTAVRSMWSDQGRKGLDIVEALVRPHIEPSVKAETISPSSSAVVTRHTPDLSGDVTPSASTSTSLSSSAPSALFSSVTTIDSVSTSVSTIAGPESRNRTTKSPSPCPMPVESSAATVTTTVATPKFIPVSTSESPLHTHLAQVSLQERLRKEELHPSPPAFVTQRADRTRSRRPRTTSESWLIRGSKTVGGLVDFVGRLPGTYLPRDPSPFRTSSCPPPTYHMTSPMSPVSPSIPDTHLETSIYLVPLHSPVHSLRFPPLPIVPRSPYRPLTPPALPTTRIRLVPNPQFLRLKALQNRVIWGLVPVLQAECEVLIDITRRHRVDTSPGRPDVDRLGQMFTAREALMSIATEGVGVSNLRYGWCAGPSTAEQGAGRGLWRWLRRNIES